MKLSSCYQLTGLPIISWQMCYLVEVTVQASSVGQQNQKSTVSHNNDTIIFMKEQIISESQTKKILSQDHLNNFLESFKLVCGMINTSKWPQWLIVYIWICIQ